MKKINNISYVIAIASVFGVVVCLLLLIWSDIYYKDLLKAIGTYVIFYFCSMFIGAVTDEDKID